LSRINGNNRYHDTTSTSHQQNQGTFTLFEFRGGFWKGFETHEEEVAAVDSENAARKAAGKRAKPKPPVPNPYFLSFNRQPLCVSFEIGNRSTTNPYQFLTVNCHLLCGKDPAERRREFLPLLG